jgi:hypothetical protein
LDSCCSLVVGSRSRTNVLGEMCVLELLIGSFFVVIVSLVALLTLIRAFRCGSRFPNPILRTSSFSIAT